MHIDYLDMDLNSPVVNVDKCCKDIWRFNNGNESTPDSRITIYLLQDTGRTSKYDLQGTSFDEGMRCFVIQSHLFWVLS